MNIIVRYNPVQTTDYPELKVNVFDIRLQWYNVTNTELYHCDISANGSGKCLEKF